MINYNALDINSFLGQLGSREGSKNYKAVYPPGASPENALALGIYQFTPGLIFDLSTKNNVAVPSNSEFLNSPSMQDRFIIYEIKDVLNYINDNGLDQAIGREVIGKGNGIKSNINVYGLLAGAHLGGKAGLKNFVWEGKDPADSLGTHISDYVSSFSETLKKKVRWIAIIGITVGILYYLKKNI